MKNVGASRIHNSVFAAVLHTPMSFFDSTPTVLFVNLLFLSFSDPRLFLFLFLFCREES